MKIVFHFILQAIFILKYLNFFPDFFPTHLGKQHGKKTMVNWKIYDGINWETNNYKITIHILSNMSKSKGKLIMKQVTTK